VEYLERRENELDKKRQELGVEDELTEVPGLGRAMLVAFGEHSIKTVEDLADCATDDLIGWSEKKDGSVTRHKGILDGFDVSREEAEQMILNARVRAGWIEAEPEAEADETDDPDGSANGAEAGVAKSQ
jgi:N utilization substance protein A